MVWLLKNKNWFEYFYLSIIAGIYGIDERNKYMTINTNGL
jgi:hypothetical protein